MVCIFVLFLKKTIKFYSYIFIAQRSFAPQLYIFILHLAWHAQQCRATLLSASALELVAIVLHRMSRSYGVAVKAHRDNQVAQRAQFKVIFIFNVFLILLISFVCFKKKYIDERKKCYRD